MKPLFLKESSPGARLLLVSVFCFALIAADMRLNQMAAGRALLSAVTLPFYWIVDLPARLGAWGEESLVSRGSLLEDNSRLRTESLLLKAQTQQMAALRAENVRLRALLNSSALLQDDVLVAELIGISPDPARHLLVLNKGSADGVFVGQPLIDADGLMGQVVELTANSCRVLLITDSTHAIPVQVDRNGMRAIAEGVGRLDSLELRHVAATEDIVVGDLLVSSGLGGRFPVGYPVAVVTEVETDPGQAFARVTAMPSAALSRSRHVLLVFTRGQDSRG
ncbi:MAG: rod shape-determining protein MreC [Halieaceae bacterium]